MSAYVELESFIDFGKVEYAYKRAVIAQQQKNYGFAEIGFRAAKARDARLLKVLEQAANIMITEDDRQRGETRNNAEKESERRYTTETQLWREAYRMVDEGKAKDVPHLKWIYGAGAFLCGYQV